MTQEEQIKSLNETEGHLKDGVDCPICKNKGVVYYANGIYRNVKDCECVVKRKINRSILDSGLADVFDRYTFDKFTTNTQYHKLMKTRALDYIKNKSYKNALDVEIYNWFVVAGQVGSGKSHICTAISKWFIEHGYDFKYLSYAQDMPRITKRMDSGYIDVKEKAEAEYDRLKSVQVLYIDDYLKANRSDKIFELINHRYGNNKLVTIISSEYNLGNQRMIDEAVSSRIYERSNGYWIDIEKGEEKNYRFNK